GIELVDQGGRGHRGPPWGWTAAGACSPLCDHISALSRRGLVVVVGRPTGERLVRLGVADDRRDEPGKRGGRGGHSRGGEGRERREPRRVTGRRPVLRPFGDLGEP